MKIKISWIDVLVVASTLLLIYLLLTRIFGHSATDLTLLVTALLTISGWLMKIEGRLGAFKEFKNQTQTRLSGIEAKLDRLLQKR